MARIVDLVKPDAKGTHCKNLDDADWKLMALIERQENQGNTFEKIDLEDEFYPRYRVKDRNNQVIHVYTLEL